MKKTKVTVRATVKEEKPSFDKAFPEVRATHDKMHEKVAEMLEGKISLKEAKAAIKEAEAALKEARKKMTAMRRAPKKKKGTNLKEQNGDA